MTDLDGTPAAAPPEPHFGGFLFWYVAIQVFAVSGFILALAAFSSLGGYLRLLDPQRWADQWTRSESAIQGGAALLVLLLCIRVASAHKLGFWRGVGGWFVGNILGSILMLPIVIVA